MSQENVETVRRGLAAWNAYNVDSPRPADRRAAVNSPRLPGAVTRFGAGRDCG